MTFCFHVNYLNISVDDYELSIVVIFYTLPEIDNLIMALHDNRDTLYIAHSSILSNESNIYVFIISWLLSKMKTNW